MESIGQKIKKIREEKGISIEDAHSATKIHPKILKAIEEDRFNDIPSALYLEGFIKKYADFLGLDTGLILEEFSQIYPHQTKAEYLLQSQKAIFSSDKKIYVTIFLYLIGIGLVLVIALLVPKNLFFFHKTVNKNVPAVSTPLPQATVRVVSSPASQSVKTLSLIVKGKEDVWIQIKSDGIVVFQNVLKKGTGKQIEANTRFDLWVGNANALSLELNGKYLVIPVRGVVKGIFIDRNGLHIAKRKK